MMQCNLSGQVCLIIIKDLIELMENKEHSAGGEVKQKGTDNGKVATGSTSRHPSRECSWSNSNSPRSSDHKFKSDIPFPCLRGSLHRGKKNRSTVQFSVNESVEVVAEDREEDQLEPKLRHPKLINDRFEFNNRQRHPSWAQRARVERGRSLGALNKVDEQKEEVEVRIKHKYNSKMPSFIDKDQFNTGTRINLTNKIDETSPTPHTLTLEITEIEESKEGLAVSVNVRSSLKQIVDEADPPKRQREQQHQQPIESIQQQRNDDQSSEQTLLRPSFQKLQQQKDMIKKMIKREEFENNAGNIENEPMKSQVTESIMEENENENENQNDN